MLNKCETLFCSARNFNYCSMPTYDNGSFPSPPPPFSQWGPLFFLSLTPGGGRKREEPKAKAAAAAATDPSSSATARKKRGIRCPLWCHFGGRGGRGLDLRGVVEKREGKDVIPSSLSSHAMGRRNIRGIASSSSFPLIAVV